MCLHSSPKSTVARQTISNTQIDVLIIFHKTGNSLYIPQGCSLFLTDKNGEYLENSLIFEGFLGIIPLCNIPVCVQNYKLSFMIYTTTTGKKIILFIDFYTTHIFLGNMLRLILNNTQLMYFCGM